MNPEKEEFLKYSNAKNVDFENYLMSTTMPQLFFDRDLVLRNFTAGAMKRFNLSLDSIGSTIYEIKEHLGCPSIIKNVKWAISKSIMIEKEVQTKDLNWYKIEIIPYLKKNENSHDGVIVTFIDITDKIKDLEEQEKLIEEYENLLVTISHDIKNGLASMVLSVQMLKEFEFITNEEFNLFLKTLDNGANEIKFILTDFYRYNITKHNYKAENELVLFEKILKELQLSLNNEITKTNLVLKFELECREIYFPKRELRSIIFNLVSNAIKFKSPDRDPEIFIKTFREDIYTVISVKDNGIGIEPQYCEKIFTKFFKIANDTEGSGLGLHRIKLIVSKAGGKVLCESQSGVGSEFKVFLKSQLPPFYRKKSMNL
ncbi:ATP-binding protein [Marivirga sp.]|uniref:ATP-binding protein n=1 Tax=Marivirga sp. TaxID=2018662 RepID=UPI0025FCFE18|nr:ATP-binding protein [Marivirga sp.]